MLCENSFCIYQSKGECTLEEIEIDVSGFCNCCIYPNIDEKILNIYKQKLLDKYDCD